MFSFFSIFYFLIFYCGSYHFKVCHVVLRSKFLSYIVAEMIISVIRSKKLSCSYYKLLINFFAGIVFPYKNCALSSHKNDFIIII